jgi:hypothetical protein
LNVVAPVQSFHTLSTILFVVIPIAVFLAMVAALALGKRFARVHPVESAGSGATTVEGSLFALFGLLVAFSFSGAETRLDARRELIVDEANAVGTAYMRLDLLPVEDRPTVKALFRDYVDSRIAIYAALPDIEKARAEQARSVELQDSIWARSVAASARVPDSRAAVVVLPSLNEAFDITTEREAATRMHVPIAIFVLLGILAVACAFLAGIGMARAGKVSHLYVFAFAGAMALAGYVILNLEFPRLGFVRFENLDALLVETRQAMR